MVTSRGRMRWCKARSMRRDTFVLDSGTQRHQAHRFYFRVGLVVT
jgi:hypothetical protein